MPENIENPNEENSNGENPENEMTDGEDLDAFDHDQGELAEETVEDIVGNLQAEVSELKDRLLRNMAETENVRRRAEKDRTDASAYAVTSFARDMLNVSDNLRRALDSAPDEISDEMKAFAEGVEMTERELINTLDRHGIKQVNPEVGEKFDHNLHQAMFEVPTNDKPNGTVMQVVAQGYVIKGRLLRPAMVGVSKAAPKVDTSA